MAKQQKSIVVDTGTFVRFWLVIAAFALAGLFLWRARTGLMIVGISIFLAIAIRPLANFIDKIDKRKKRVGITSALAVLIVVSVIGIVAFTAGPVVVGETSRFVAQAPEMFDEQLGGWEGINSFGQSIGIADLKGQIMSGIENFSNSFLENFSGTLFTSISAVANFLTCTVLTIVLTLLFLLQGPKIMDTLWNKLADKDEKSTQVARRVIHKIANVIAKYVTSQIIVGVLDGAVCMLAIFIISSIFGFSSSLAIPMGLIAMVFFLIPMFGAVITCVLVSMILFFSSPAGGIAFAAFYIIYQQIENNIIAPKIQGNVLDLPSLIILIAITIGMYMFGILGAIISIPIAGCIKVIVDEYPNIKEALKE